MNSFIFQLALGTGGGDVDIVGTGNHRIVLCWCILVGIIVGIICAFINIFSKKSDSGMISFIVDFAMTLAAAAIYVLTIYLADFGVVRVYSALSYLSSLIISCHYAEKILIKTKNKIFSAFKKIGEYLKKVFKVEELRIKMEKRKAEKTEKLKKRNAAIIAGNKKKMALKLEIKQKKQIEEDANKKKKQAVKKAKMEKQNKIKVAAHIDKNTKQIARIKKEKERKDVIAKKKMVRKNKNGK